MRSLQQRLQRIIALLSRLEEEGKPESRRRTRPGFRQKPSKLQDPGNRLRKNTDLLGKIERRKRERVPVYAKDVLRSRNNRKLKNNRRKKKNTADDQAKKTREWRAKR